MDEISILIFNSGILTHLQNSTDMLSMRMLLPWMWNCGQVQIRHSICWDEFNSQEELDAHVADLLADLVCRINEGMLLKKDQKKDQNCGPSPAG
jgi:hypothetical protein